MKKLLAGAFALTLSFAAQPVLAAGNTYECKIKDTKGQGYWLPEVLFIGHDTTENVVVVSDPIILHFNDRQPVKGKVSVDNKKRITFTWKLRVKSGSGQTARISYRATYLKGDGSMSISGAPLGYENRFNARGTCQVKALK